MDSEDGAWEASEGDLKAVPPVAVQGQTPLNDGFGGPVPTEAGVLMHFV